MAHHPIPESATDRARDCAALLDHIGQRLGEVRCSEALGFIRGRLITVLEMIGPLDEDQIGEVLNDLREDA